MVGIIGRLLCFLLGLFVFFAGADMTRTAQNAPMGRFICFCGLGCMIAAFKP